MVLSLAAVAAHMQGACMVLSLAAVAAHIQGGHMVLYFVAEMLDPMSGEKLEQGVQFVESGLTVARNYNLHLESLGHFLDILAFATAQEPD